MSRRTKWIFGSVAIFFAGLVLFVFFISRDEPPPADQDLRNYRREVAEEKNGFQLINFDYNEIDWEECRKGLDWKDDEFDAAAAQKLLDDNQEALARWEDSLKAADFQVPEITSFNDEIRYFVAWNRLAQLIDGRARLASETGKIQEALADHRRLIRFGHRIANGQGALDHYMIGQSICSRGLRRLVQLVQGAKLEAKDIKVCQESLESCRLESEALADAYRAEYICFANMLDDLAQGNFNSGRVICLPPIAKISPMPLLFKPNQTKHVYAEEMRRMIDNVSKSPGERQTIDLESRFGKLSGLGKLRFLNNGVGKSLVLHVLPNIDGVVSMQDLARAQMALVQTLLSLKAYHLEHGKLPVGLEELVPKHLKALPIDPYDGKPLRYSAEKKLLYCLGKDLKDAGGSAKEPDQRFGDVDEPTLGIEFE